MNIDSILKIVDYLFKNPGVTLSVAFALFIFQKQITILLLALIRKKYGSYKEKNGKEEAKKRSDFSPLQKMIGDHIPIYKMFVVVEFSDFSPAIVFDENVFSSEILEKIDIQRKKNERISFSLIGLSQLNVKFIQAWKIIALRVLSENNVAMKMIFPVEGKCSALDELYKHIESEIKTRGKTTIELVRSL